MLRDAKIPVISPPDQQHGHFFLQSCKVSSRASLAVAGVRYSIEDTILTGLAV
jgi:hypothetical protein